MSNTQNARNVDSSAAHDPNTVGNTFMKQYYHLLSKSPELLHRFYKDTSLWCHGTGSQMEPAITGQKDINDQIMGRGYAGARVDLDNGSIDCQQSLNGSVLVLVTGVMTLTSSSVPKSFVQTFFLAVQPNGYFLLNDVLRFLETPKSKEESVAEAVNVTADGEKNVYRATEDSNPEISPLSTAQTGKLEPAAVNTNAIERPAIKQETANEPIVSKNEIKEPEQTKEDRNEVIAEINPASFISSKTEEPEAETAEASSDDSPTQSPEKNTKASSQSAPKSWAHLFSRTSPSKSAAVVPMQSSKPATISKPIASPKSKLSDSTPSESKKLFSIYIRDFATSTKEQELRELFSPFGEIANVTIGGEKSYAFVDFVELESVKKVLAISTPFTLSGKPLYVDERGERKENRGNFRGDNRGRGRSNRENTKSRSNNKRSNGDKNTNGVTSNAIPGSAPIPFTPRSDRREKGNRRGTNSAGRGNRNE